MLSSHKNMTAIKALEDKVSPMVKSLEEVCRITVGLDDLSTAKESLQQYSDARSVLASLETAGKVGSAEPLAKVLEELIAWAKRSLSPSFEQALVEISGKFGGDMNISNLGSYQEIAGLFDSNLPATTVPESVDRRFILHCFLVDGLDKSSCSRGMVCC